MTSEREFRRLLAEVLDEGPTAAPPVLVEEVTAQLAAVGWVPRRRIRTGRWAMSLPMKLVLGTATLAAAAVLAVVATGPSRNATTTSVGASSSPAWSSPASPGGPTTSSFSPARSSPSHERPATSSEDVPSSARADAFIAPLDGVSLVGRKLEPVPPNAPSPKVAAPYPANFGGEGLSLEEPVEYGVSKFVRKPLGTVRRWYVERLEADPRTVWATVFELDKASSLCDLPICPAGAARLQDDQTGESLGYVLLWPRERAVP